MPWRPDRGQAVLGANCRYGTGQRPANGDQNLFRYRLPVMLFAVDAPYTLHGELPDRATLRFIFVQDPFDIAARQAICSNGEYSLPSGIVVKEAIVPAQCVRAKADPPGPVYLDACRGITLGRTIWTLPTCPPIRRRGMAALHTGRHRSL